MKKTKKIFKYIFVLLIITFIFTNNVYASCPLGEDVTKDLYGALKFLRILAPLLVIVLSSVDAVRALMKGDGGADFKKVAQRFGKRCIYAVLLFFLPVLIDQFMQMADVWEAGGTCDIESPAKSEDDETTNSSTTTTSPIGPEVARVTCESLGKTWDYVNNKCIDSYETTTTSKNSLGETIVDPTVYVANPKSCYTEVPDFTTNVDGNPNYRFDFACVNSKGKTVDCTKAKAPYKYRLLATYGKYKNRVIKEWSISEKCNDTTTTTTTTTTMQTALIDPVVKEVNPKSCYTEVPDFTTNVDGNSNYRFNYICVTTKGAKIDCVEAKAPYKFRLLATYGKYKNRTIKEWTISENC